MFDEIFHEIFQPELLFLLPILFFDCIEIDAEGALRLEPFLIDFLVERLSLFVELSFLFFHSFEHQLIFLVLNNGRNPVGGRVETYVTRFVRDDKIGDFFVDVSQVERRHNGKLSSGLRDMALNKLVEVVLAKNGRVSLLQVSLLHQQLLYLIFLGYEIFSLLAHSSA